MDNLPIASLSALESLRRDFSSRSIDEMIEMVLSTLLEVADDDDDEEEDDESTDPLLFFFRFLCAVGSGFGVASCFDLV